MGNLLSPRSLRLFMLSLIIVSSSARAQTPANGFDQGGNLMTGTIVKDQPTPTTVKSVNDPGYVPTNVMPAAAQQPIAATPPVQDNSMLQACLSGLAGLLGSMGQKTSEGVEDIANAANEAEGFKEGTYDKEFYSQLSKDVNARFNGDCKQAFIDKEGRLGPWGRIVEYEIQQCDGGFANDDRIPPDMLQLCPGHANFDKKKQEEHWIHTMMSLASPESSCDQKAKNPNAPNGTAMGLYQLEPSICRSVGVYGNLYDGQNNTRCAARVLCKELKRRGTLMSPTSKSGDYRATYWGPLRSDDHNKARGGDIAGALKFRALVGQFPGCK